MTPATDCRSWAASDCSHCLNSADPRKLATSGSLSHDSGPDALDPFGVAFFLLMSSTPRAPCSGTVRASDSRARQGLAWSITRAVATAYELYTARYRPR